MILQIQLRMVSLLLEWGADRDCQMIESGVTPLLLACHLDLRHKKFVVLEVFQQAGEGKNLFFESSWVQNRWFLSQ